MITTHVLKHGIHRKELQHDWNRIADASGVKFLNGSSQSWLSGCIQFIRFKRPGTKTRFFAFTSHSRTLPGEWIEFKLKDGWLVQVPTDGLVKLPSTSSTFPVQYYWDMSNHESAIYGMVKWTSTRNHIDEGPLTPPAPLQELATAFPEASTADDDLLGVSWIPTIGQLAVVTNTDQTTDLATIEGFAFAPDGKLMVSVRRVIRSNPIFLYFIEDIKPYVVKL